MKFLSDAKINIGQLQMTRDIYQYFFSSFLINEIGQF